MRDRTTHDVCHAMRQEQHLQVSDTIRSRAWDADQQDADAFHVLNKEDTTLNALKTDTQAHREYGASDHRASRISASDSSEDKSS